MTPGRERVWRVGELADVTGVAARILHFYDEIGLLVPSERAPAGHRVYAEDDVRRLYRIVVLRRLGHPVRKIPSLLAEGGIGLPETVRRHLEEEQDEERQRPLREILGLLERSVEPSGERFVEALEAMSRR